ncbi:MAG: DNA/RNA helicase domain-containing protein [Thermomicrobiales bacterium]
MNPYQQFAAPKAQELEETIAALEQSANDAMQTGGRHLALVTGVPGAGKTLVGLQFVYGTREDGENSKE